ncbi:MAG: hypothetical protein ACYCVB_01105, partial [Bacilli bacterium]
EFAKNAGDAIFILLAARQHHDGLFQKYDGPCRSESSFAPLLKQRFAQLATGAIDDSSLSGP